LNMRTGYADSDYRAIFEEAEKFVSEFPHHQSGTGKSGVHDNIPHTLLFTVRDTRKHESAMTFSLERR
jgi:hypothetical protein